MLRRNIKLILLVFFFLAIFIPGAILGFLALRAIEREEAYIEKGLRNTLYAEVAHALNLINNELNTIQEELATIIEYPVDSYSQKLLAMKAQSNLIQIPFLVSSQREILWPYKGKLLNREESLFLDYNEELFEDEIAIPIYKNIAIEYREQIINDQEVQRGQELDINSNDIASQQEETAEYQENMANQQAISRFEQSEPLRSKIYKQAEEEGQTVVTRNIIVPEEDSSELGRQWSFFILESHTFSQIIEQAAAGIIPRFVEDELMLLYWEKNDQQDITGCVIDKNSLKQRLLTIIPPFYTQTRILVILDEKATPLLTTQLTEYPQWQQPFVAREISTILPRWEIAAYLTDPNLVQTRVQTTSLVLGILISLLLGFILIGGLIIVRLMFSEITLAQQKTNFVANVSHELKTPLTSIRLFSEMLSNKRQPDKNKRQAYFEIMVSETERLTRLINNVLDFSRMNQKKKKYKKKRINIVALCSDVMELQRTRLEHSGFSLNFPSQAEEIFIHADEEAIKQVLINLLANAEKYSLAKKEIVIRINTTAQNVRIQIMDRGPGVPKNRVKKIFKAFYRLDDPLTARTRGSGLGLAICRSLLHDQGADIKYIPRKGGGSIFQICFPRE